MTMPNTPARPELPEPDGRIETHPSRQAAYINYFDYFRPSTVEAYGTQVEAWARADERRKHRTEIEDLYRRLAEVQAERDAARDERDQARREALEEAILRLESRAELFPHQSLASIETRRCIGHIRDMIDKEQTTAVVRPLTSCAAHRDGECSHPNCPQIRDGEPRKSGRHCPLDTGED